MLTYLLTLLDDASDKAMFTDLYGRYGQMTLKVAMSILQNTYDAEDAVIDAWTKIALHFSTAKKKLSKSWSELEAWIVVIAKNAAKDEWRKRKRAPEPVEVWDIASHSDTETKGEVQLAIELIRALPEQTRRLIELRFAGEYSWKEIGKMLGCSAGTAQKRYTRAMADLRKRMREE